MTLPMEPHTTEKAQIRSSTTLCDEEKNAIAIRIACIKKTLETALGMTLIDDQIPRIAICASGGGFRAMFTSLGAISGSTLPNCSPSNMLDLTLYFAALSGSTWAITGMEYSGMNAHEYIEHVAPELTKNLLDDFNMEDLVLELKKKEQNKLPVSFIDVYGILLAQRLFNHLDNPNPSSINLVDYIQKYDVQRLPIPIQTSVIGNATLDHYEWAEFTPYEVGSLYLNSFIPTWSLGRPFNNGSSTAFPPALSVGLCIGMWSSAMCIDPKDFFDLVVQDKLEKQLYETLVADFGKTFTNYLEDQFGSLLGSGINVLHKLRIDHLYHLEQAKNGVPTGTFSGHHFSPGQIFNWNFGVPNAPLNSDQFLTLVDAGLDINIPFPPLLRPDRAVNIILVFDASADPALELTRTAAYAKKHNLLFPPIDYSKISNPCSIHQDTENKNAPIVIFIPMVKNSGYQNGWDPLAQSFTGIFNDKYTPDQTHLLTGLLNFSMTQSMPLIMDTIKKWIMDRK